MIRKTKPASNKGAGGQPGVGVERVPARRPDQPGNDGKPGQGKLVRELKTHQAELKQRKEELLNAQAQLEASQEKYFDLYHVAPVGYFSISEKGIILDVNITGANLFGVVPPDLYARQFISLVYKEDHDVYQFHRQQLFETMVPQLCEMRMVRGDGSIFWARIEASVARHAQAGKPVCHAVMSDVSEQRHLEEQRNIALEKYRVLFESFPLGITITDAMGNIVEANKESESLLGLERDEHIGRKYDGPEWQFIRRDGSLMPPEEFASVQALKEKRRIANQEVGLVDDDGQTRWLNVTAEPIPLRDYGVAITYGDITERKQAEEALRQSEENYRSLAAYNKQLNDMFIAFNESVDLKELYNAVAESLHILTRSIAATFSIYDPETQALKAAALSADSNYSDKIAAYFGTGLFEMQMPVSPGIREQMLDQPVRRVKDLHELSMGEIPPEISGAVMHDLGIRQIIALAISYGVDIEGTCVAYLPENTPVVPDSALRTFAYMAGLAIKRKQAETALRSSANFLTSIVENSPHAMWISDNRGTLVRMNQACRDLLNIKDDEVVGKYNIFHDSIIEEQGFMPLVRDVFENGTTVKFSLKYESSKLQKLQLPRPSYVVLEVTVSAVRDAQGKITNAVIQNMDITQRTQDEEKRELSLKIMGLLNKSGNRQDLIRQILLLIKDFSGCEAVGIRLREGDDYPYFQTDGFIPGHIELENRLCAYDEEGRVVRDFEGDPVLECMCGNIILGRFNPELPFFTPGGSFWTNCTTELLSTTTEEDRQAHTRNRCNGEGYESVALVPLRGQGRNIGLLQLNDTRRNRFTPGIIHYYEGIASSIGIVLDRKQAEEALLRASEMLSLAQQSAGTGIWDWDMKTGVLNWTPEFYLVFGLDPDKDMPTFDTWRHVLHPDDRQSAEDRINQAILDRVPLQNEYRIVLPSGEVRWINALGNTLYDEEGRAVRMTGICIDITDRKKAREELLEGEEKYRNLFENAMEAIFVASGGRIVFCNPRSVTITGHHVEELMEKQFAEFIHPADREMVIDRHIRRSRGEPLPDTYEFRIIQKSGAVRWVELSTVLINWEGQPATLNFLEDITERKETGEKLANSYRDLKRTIDETIIAMARIVEMKDPYTAGHQVRVALLAAAIAAEMRMPDEQIEYLNMAATVHDIGKIYVPSDILSKPGKLSKIEFDMIKTHARGAYDILKDIAFKGPVAEIAYQHHERLDGSGYPNQLKGEEIINEARILAVADVVEAMSSHRPYRPALGIDVALEEISRNRGRLYDPAVVDACVELFRSGRFELKPV